MKSLKLKLFEYRQGLNIEQDKVAQIVTEHMNLCDSYSEKEIFGSLVKCLDTFKFYENVTPFLNEIDEELTTNSLLYNLKDLYAKVARKENQFLYESALHALIECINQTNDEDRKIKILNDLKLYEWIYEVKLFLSEVASTPQLKQNFLSKGGKIDDVFSIVLQIKEGLLTHVADKWFLLNDEGVFTTLLENHISDEIQLKKLRLLEEAVEMAEFSDERITFKIAEELVVSFDIKSKQIYLNESENDKGTTLETLFNSPIIPFMGKAYYPILNETFNNLDKFLNVDAVKHIYNLANTSFECYVFNYKGKISQYRVDHRMGSSFYAYENAMPLIENVMHELGADLTFFFEDLLSEEIKSRVKLENQEKQLLEKLTDIENAIINIKNESQILKENVAIQGVYNSLLSKKHKISEEIKVIKNKKAELYN